jgi:hypothetical protein
MLFGNFYLLVAPEEKTLNPQKPTVITHSSCKPCEESPEAEHF